jgi:hypothetical protein
VSAAVSAAAKLRSDTRRHYNTARIWQAVIDQDTHWVPQPAWADFIAASVGGYVVRDVVASDSAGRDVYRGDPRFGVVIRPDFSVDGVIEVSSMGLSHRRAVIGFMWRRSRYICSGLQWGTMHLDDPFGMDVPECVIDDQLDTDMAFMHRALDESARRAWFNDRPLIKALRASVEADLDRRVPRPVLL